MWVLPLNDSRIYLCFLELDTGTGLAGLDHEGQQRLWTQLRVQRENELSSVKGGSILCGLKGDLRGNKKWASEPSSEFFACLWSPLNKFGFVLVMDFTLQIWEGWHCWAIAPNEISQDCCITVDKSWAAGVLGVSCQDVLRNWKGADVIKHWNWLCSAMMREWMKSW